VVGLPGGVGLGGAGTGELGLVGADRGGAPGGRGGALRTERAAGAGGPERRDTATVFDRPDRHAHLRGAGNGIGGQVDGEAVLGESPAQRGRRLHLGHNPRARTLQPRQQRPSAIGSIAVNGQLLRGNAFGVRIRRSIVRVVHHAGETTALAAAAVAAPVPVRVVVAVGHRFGQILGQQVFGWVGVAAVGGGDRGGGDDLRIRIGGEVALVAVEPARGGLVSVPRLRVYRGDHPILGDSARD